MVPGDDRPADPLSDELDAVAHRVRVVQRKRFFASAVAGIIAATIIIAGEVLLILAGGGHSSRSNGSGAWIPFVVALPIAWRVRMRLWPKDPTI